MNSLHVNKTWLSISHYSLAPNELEPCESELNRKFSLFLNNRHLKLYVNWELIVKTYLGCSIMIDFMTKEQERFTHAQLLELLSLRVLRKSVIHSLSSGNDPETSCNLINLDSSSLNAIQRWHIDSVLIISEISPEVNASNSSSGATSFKKKCNVYLSWETWFPEYSIKRDFGMYASSINCCFLFNRSLFGTESQSDSINNTVVMLSKCR